MRGVALRRLALRGEARPGCERLGHMWGWVREEAMKLGMPHEEKEASISVGAGHDNWGNANAIYCWRGGRTKGGRGRGGGVILKENWWDVNVIHLYISFAKKIVFKFYNLSLHVDSLSIACLVVLEILVSNESMTFLPHWTTVTSSQSWI